MTSWGDAIAAEFQHVVTFIIAFIPNLLGFLIILGVGWIVAWVLEQAVTRLLRRVGFDRLANRIGLTRFEQNMGVHMDAAGLLGKIVFWFILLIFLVPASNALGLPVVSSTINTLVTYIPNVFVAVLILFLGTLAATVVADLVRGATASAGIGNPNIFASVARWAIILFAALMALNQLQISPALINVLFTSLVGGLGLGLALAFGISFGLGGQEAARRWLARGENTLGTLSSQINADQVRRDAARANREAQLEADRQASLANANKQDQSSYIDSRGQTYSPSSTTTVADADQATTPQQPVQQPPLQTGYPQPYTDPRQGRITNEPARTPGVDQYPTQNQVPYPQPGQEPGVDKQP